MVHVPADIPITTPVAMPTEAMDGLELLHVPPAVTSLSVDVPPTVVVVVPVIAAGDGVTVTKW
jgi:hypothetical protein